MEVLRLRGWVSEVLILQFFLEWYGRRYWGNVGVAGIVILPGVVVEVLHAGCTDRVGEGVLEGGREEVLRLHMKVS